MKADKYGQKPVINGNNLKRLVGGDEGLTLRQNHQNTTEKTVHFTLWILANDAPRIQPIDKAIHERGRRCNIPRSAVAQVSDASTQFNIDYTLKSRVKTDSELQDRWARLVFRAYKRWWDRAKRDGAADAEQIPSAIRQDTDEYIPVNRVEEVIRSSFEVYDEKIKRTDLAQSWETLEPRDIPLPSLCLAIGKRCGA